MGGCGAKGSSTGSDLEAFSHKPADGSIATLASQLTALTECGSDEVEIEPTNRGKQIASRGLRLSRS